MKKNIKVTGNSAMDFGTVIRDLLEISRDRNISPQEAGRMFLSDLKNSDTEGYEKKVSEITISGKIPQSVYNRLVSFVQKNLIERYDKVEEQKKHQEKRQEKKDKAINAWNNIKDRVIDSDGKYKGIEDIEKIIIEVRDSEDLSREERNYVLKRLEELKTKVENLAKQAMDKQLKANSEKNINKKFMAIVKTVENVAEQEGKSKLELWEEIRKKLVLGQSNFNVPEASKDKVRELIDEKIEEEGKDYEHEVRRYTKDFQFLGGYRESTFAAYGHRKFLNKENAIMFENFVAELRNNERLEKPEKEQDFLKRLIKEKKINTYYGEKFVKARLETIDKEKLKHQKSINWR